MTDPRRPRPDEAQAECERARLEALVRVEAALRRVDEGRVIVIVQGGRPVAVEITAEEPIA